MSDREQWRSCVFFYSGCKHLVSTVKKHRVVVWDFKVKGAVLENFPTHHLSQPPSRLTPPADFILALNVSVVVQGLPEEGWLQQ